MKSILKTVKQLETTYEVLEYIENVISKIKDSEFIKNILDIDNDFVSWQRIEIIASDDVMSLRKKIDGYYDFL